MDEATLRLYEDAIDEHGTLSGDDVRGLIGALRAVQQRLEDAVIHYRIGEECRAGLVYVDWEYVCDRMAGALTRLEEASADVAARTT